MCFCTGARSNVLLAPVLVEHCWCWCCYFSANDVLLEPVLKWCLLEFSAGLRNTNTLIHLKIYILCCIKLVSKYAFALHLQEEVSLGGEQELKLTLGRIWSFAKISLLLATNSCSSPRISPSIMHWSTARRLDIWSFWKWVACQIVWLAKLMTWSAPAVT